MGTPRLVFYLYLLNSIGITFRNRYVKYFTHPRYSFLVSISSACRNAFTIKSTRHNLDSFQCLTGNLFCLCQGHCCGFHGYKDYLNSTIGATKSLPASCCNELYGHPGCGRNLLRHKDGYRFHDKKRNKHYGLDRMEDQIHLKVSF